MLPTMFDIERAHWAYQPEDLGGAQRQAVRRHCELRHQRLCLGVKARRANRMTITRVEAATGAPGRS